MNEIDTHFGPFRLVTRSNGRDLIETVITLRDRQKFASNRYLIKKGWTITTAHDETYKWLKRNFNRFCKVAAKKTQDARLART